MLTNEEAMKHLEACYRIGRKVLYAHPKLKGKASSFKKMVENKYNDCQFFETARFITVLV